MHQTDNIKDFEKELTIDGEALSSSVNQLRKIAEQSGTKAYNGLYDNPELEAKLHDLIEKQNPNIQPFDARNSSSNINNQNLSIPQSNPFRQHNMTNLSSPNMYRNGLGTHQNGEGTSLERLKRNGQRGQLSDLSAMSIPKGNSDNVDPSSLKNNDKRGSVLPGKSKSLKQKDKEDEEKQLQSGNFSIELKRTTKVKLAIFCSIFGSIMILFICILSIIADTKGASIVMGEMASEDKSLLEDVIDEIGDAIFDDTGHGSQDQGLGNSALYEYQERFKVLGNVFSSEYKCISEECITRAEYKYYLKLADIALRYKNKYGVTLDWVLLSATASYNEFTDEEIMALHSNDYNEGTVENYSILMDLDWDYDYTKIPGYQYLSPDDYRYDLQILAKNMVTKTTTQTCIRKKSGGGAIDIVATQTDIDIEEPYFEPGQPKHLSCPAGTTYDRSSTYVLDKNKYDEFLMEYLEHKFYLPSDEPSGPSNENGNVNIGYTEGNSLSSNMVNLAISQKGISGRPNKFTKWLGPINGYPSNGYAYPWCATFVSWVVANTNYNGTNLNSIINYRSASAVAWARHFRDASNLQFKYSKHYGGNYTPKQGDLIFFTWKNTGFNKESLYGIDHIAIVSKVEGNYIYTIEGNINNSSVTGGNVAERKYDANAYQIDGYGIWY